MVSVLEQIRKIREAQLAKERVKVTAQMETDKVKQIRSDPIKKVGEVKPSFKSIEQLFLPENKIKGNIRPVNVKAPSEDDRERLNLRDISERKDFPLVRPESRGIERSPLGNIVNLIGDFLGGFRRG